MPSPQLLILILHLTEQARQINPIKKGLVKKPDLHFVAENEGFEPPVPRGTTVFKTAAIDHSANSPGQR